MQLLKNYESTLVKRVCNGDNTAFREIVENNKQKIFYLAYDLTGSKEDAEDLSQEVFIKAFRSIHRFRGDATLSSWLYRITFNAFLDLKRKKSYQMEKENQPLDEGLSADSFSGDGSPSTNPETYTESRQIQMHIEQTLNLLSPRERSVFMMRHYRGMSGKEVGSLLDISEGTVKSLLSRAVKKMQNALGFYRTTPVKKKRIKVIAKDEEAYNESM